MNSRQETGRLGELAARRHLESVGYTVLETNARRGRHEIDIVAEEDGVLSFVEVRTRRGRAMGAPEESITPQKRSQMLHAAQAYLEEAAAPQREWRIDLVAVELDHLNRIVRLSLIRNAIEL